MNNTTTRKYNKTKFEGVFWRASAKRDPRTGELDRVYSFWFADHAGKGHWKTVGRHSKGVRPQTARIERGKFLAELEAGVNPVQRDKVTIGQAVEEYLAWGKSEGKYVDQHYSQYATHLREKIHATPIVDVTPGLLSALKAELLKTPAGSLKPKNRTGKTLQNRAEAKPRKLLAGSTVNNIFNFMRSSVKGRKSIRTSTDEYGRVKAQFFWDRAGQWDESTSCWVRVSQGWASNVYGTMAIPRIEHGVIVSFLEGNPDRPIITGRVYHELNRPPYELPEHKTRTVFKSLSTPGEENEARGFNEFRIEEAKLQTLENILTV
jgi:hypothetical protein